jgi:hypothetical protein
MNKKTRNSLYIVLSIVIIITILFDVRIEMTKKSPVPVEVNQPSDTTQRTLIIGADTQGTYGDLRIGVGPARRDNYTTDTGEQRIGRVIGLWLYYRLDASKNTEITVYIGQHIQIGKYSFIVKNIEGGSGAVELRFDSNP